MTTLKGIGHYLFFMESASFPREASHPRVTTKLQFPYVALKRCSVWSLATVMPREQLQLDGRKAFQGATAIFPIFGALLPIFFGGVFMYLGLTRYVQNMKYHNIHISKKRCILIRKPRPKNITDSSLQVFLEDPNVVFMYHQSGDRNNSFFARV